MILADNEEQRREALNKLLPMQRGDFEAHCSKRWAISPSRFVIWIRRCMNSLPTQEEAISEIAEDMGVGVGEDQGEDCGTPRSEPDDGSPRMQARNLYPELAEMQTRAVFEAYVNVKKRNPEYDGT